MATVGYIASTIPAQTVFASGTTLFHIAMLQTGDALQWVAIAQLNDLLDPWINSQEEILIPPVFPTGTQTGILKGASSSFVTTAPTIAGTALTPNEIAAAGLSGLLGADGSLLVGSDGTILVG